MKNLLLNLKPKIDIRRNIINTFFNYNFFIVAYLLYFDLKIAINKTH